MKIDSLSLPKLLGFGFLVILVAIISSVGFFIFNQNNTAGKPAANLLQDPKKELNSLIEVAGRLIELPKDEVPVLATFPNLGQYADQVVFSNAEFGDKLLIYKSANKAYLYRPSADKIIEAGPLKINPEVAGESTSATQISPSPEKQVKITIFNGTKKGGLASKYESIIKKNFPDVMYTLGNSKNDYDKTIVIIFNALQKDIALKIASDLKAETSTLPAGEDKPVNTDILIILGTDKH